MKTIHRSAILLALVTALSACTANSPTNPQPAFNFGTQPAPHQN